MDVYFRSDSTLRIHLHIFCLVILGESVYLECTRLKMGHITSLDAKYRRRREEEEE